MDRGENIGLSCNLINKSNKMFKLCVLDDDLERVKNDPHEEISNFFENFQIYLEVSQSKYNIERMNRYFSSNDNEKKIKKSCNSDSENNSELN